MSCGISQQINCYSMLTWSGSLEYTDAATGDLRTAMCEPGVGGTDGACAPNSGWRWLLASGRKGAFGGGSGMPQRRLAKILCRRPCG